MELQTHLGNGMLIIPILSKSTTSQPRQLDYLVPQGGVYGTFLFIAYASTLDLVMSPSGLELKGFVDDHSIKTTLKPSKLGHRDGIYLLWLA